MTATSVPVGGTRRRAALACALVLTGVPVVLTTVALRLVDASAYAGSRHSPYLEFAVYAIANSVAFAAVVAVTGWGELRAYGLRIRVSRGRIAGAAGGFIVGVVIFGLVTDVAEHAGLGPIRGMNFDAPTGAELVTLFLSVALMAAFCEEVFFRVLWVGGLRTFLPDWLAGALAISAFAIIHYPYFGLSGVIFITLWAIVPVWLFLQFGDVTAPLLMHVMNNAFAYVIVPLVAAQTR